MRCMILVSLVQNNVLVPSLSQTYLTSRVGQNGAKCSWTWGRAWLLLFSVTIHCNLMVLACDSVRNSHPALGAISSICPLPFSQDLSPNTRSYFRHSAQWCSYHPRGLLWRQIHLSSRLISTVCLASTQHTPAICSSVWLCLTWNSYFCLNALCFVPMCCISRLFSSIFSQLSQSHCFKFYKGILVNLLCGLSLGWVHFLTDLSNW